MLNLLAAIVLAPPVAINAGTMSRHVNYLASPELEGRLTLTKGIDLAADYIAEQFKSYGLKPLEGDDFFHRYAVTVGSRFTAKNTLKIGGQEHKVGEDFLPLIGSPNDKPVEAEVVFIGFGDEDYSAFDVRGKIVLAFRGSRTGNMVSNGIKARTAQNKGAIGMIFMGAPKEGMPELPNFNAGQAVPGDLNLVSVIAKSDLFKALAGKEYSDERKDPRPRALGLTVKIQTDIEPNSGQAKNVIAVLPGTDPKLKDEFIIFGAHYDHLGYGEVSSRTGAAMIHYGADDNASGTAAVLGLAEYFAKEKSNKRTMLFQLYSGEEVGLIGSSAWVKDHPEIVAKTSAMINLDMVGRVREGKLFVYGTGSSPDWPDLLKSISEPGLRLLTAPNVRSDSDQASFAMKQVPVLFFHSGLHDEYHSEKDAPSTVDSEGIARVARGAAQLALAVDAGPKLRWNEKTELGNRVTDRDNPGTPAPGGQQRGVRIGFMPDYADGGPGILITGTSEDSPAAKAGFRAGDRVLEMNGVKLDSLETMSEVMRTLKPGDKVKVVFERDGKKLEAELVAEARGYLLRQGQRGRDNFRDWLRTMWSVCALAPLLMWCRTGNDEVGRSKAALKRRHST